MDGTYRALPTPASRLGTRTPAGVSSLEPGQTLGTRPVAPPRDKCLTVHVRLLDDSMEMLDVEPKCDGQVLLAQLWGRLNLMECDYFGLEFQNAPSCWVWLDPAKPLARQVRRPKNTVLRLAVKFFPPDPGQLQEEFTRYLFALQLRRDLREGRLSCTDTTAALLASHLLQAELGDYEETLDREHLKAHQYLPSQEHCLEKILEFHQKHMGQTPAESDFQVLEVARKLEMYGVRLHAASDREGARIHLAAFHTGVLVFQGTTKINTFNWSKVRKLSFRRKRFLVKLHPEAHGPYQDTLEFLLGSRDACKNFWKVCVEHHTFFRLCDQPKPKAKAVLFSRGSSFRYSGRTQKQLVGCIKEGPMRRAPYERRHSRMRACIQETRQSVSFTEGLRTSASPPPADTTPGSLPTSPLAPRGHLSLQDNSGPQLEPPALDTMRPAAEGSHRPPCQAQTPGAPAGPPSPGAGSGLGVQNRSPGSPLGHGPEAGVGPIFTVASRQLQVLEEFIDDDPADICFYAGGREAFLPYGASREPPTPCSGQSSPDRFSTEAMHMEDGFGSEEEEEEEEGEEEGGFGAVGHPADTCELLAMKAQASLMHSLLATSSGRPHPHAHGGSLGCLPLTGPAARTPSSATQSEASSMANFPACSVRSESSSGLQFCDLLEQLGQLSGAPGPAPAPASGSSASSSSSSSSSSDIESWGSGAQAPLDISLFFSRPLMALGADSLTLDVQSHPRNPAPGDWLDGDHC